MREFLESFIAYLFGCRHRRYSFPLTVGRKRQAPPAARRTGSYVACLDCGQELPYDWKQMKVLRGAIIEPREWPAPPMPPVPASK